MRTPLSRARGLGSAKHGTEHFWRQRVTSVALVPLAVFFLAAILALAGADHERVVAVLSSLWVAIPMLLVVVITAVHMRLGMQVIIEDYVHRELAKLVLLITNTAFTAVVALTGVVALLMLVVGG